MTEIVMMMVIAVLTYSWQRAQYILAEYGRQEKAMLRPRLIGFSEHWGKGTMIRAFWFMYVPFSSQTSTHSTLLLD